MKYFLLSFDRQLGCVVEEIVEFDDPDDAVRARFRREAVKIDRGVEVVVLGAADRGALTRTHSRYFGGPDLDVVDDELTPVPG